VTVCRLLKPLYRMKQGAHDWYAELRKIFVKYDYSISNADEAVFHKFDSAHYTIVATATDDFTIIGDSTDSTSLIKKQLSNYFEIANMGEIKWLLGISITRDPKSKLISLGQQAYIEQITKHFDLENVRTTTTLMEPGVDLTTDSPSVSPTLLMSPEKT
jgi:hypothetical protein